MSSNAKEIEQKLEILWKKSVDRIRELEEDIKQEKMVRDKCADMLRQSYSFMEFGYVPKPKVELDFEEDVDSS